MLRTRKKLLFATQVYYEKLQSSGNKNLLNDLKKEAYQIKKADLSGQTWSKTHYVHGYTSYGSSQSGFDRLHRVSSSFQGLENGLNRHLKKYLQQLDFEISSGDLEMTHCWVNIMGKNSLHTAHTHPLSVISGTFYVDTPKGSSSIKFEDPRMGLFMNTPPVKANAKIQNQRYIEIQPSNGYLVLFESWLKHEVPMQTSSSERISISFNYGWRS